MKSWHDKTSMIVICIGNSTEHYLLTFRHASFLGNIVLIVQHDLPCASFWPYLQYHLVHTMCIYSMNLMIYSEFINWVQIYLIEWVQ